MPYTEYSGNELFLYQLFCLGSGRMDVEEIRIAKTTAWSKATGYADAFSDIEFEMVQAGAEVTLFPANVVTSAEVSGQTLDGPNKDGGWIGPFVAAAPNTRANYLAFDIVFPGGAGHINDDGSIGAREIIIRREAQAIDDLGQPTGDWFLLGQDSFQFATRTAQRLSLRHEVPPGRYQARCRRINDSSTGSRDWDEARWDGLRCYLIGDNVFPAQMLAMRARATNQLSSQASRQVTVIGTSMLPTWTGAGWTAPMPTREIFPIAADILRNAEYGGARPDNRIDIDKLVSLDATWRARGDHFDGVFDQNQSVWDVLSDVLMVGRSRPIEIGDTVTFVRDEPVAAPKLLLTPREIANPGLSIDYDLFDPTTPDDVLIEYVDERTWDMGASVRATLPGSASRNPARMRIKGITDRARAWRHGMYLAAVNKYRREYLTAPVEYDGNLLKAGDLVALSHPLCDYGQPADVLEYDAATRTLRLSQRANLSPAETNYMRLRRRDGSPWGPVIVTAGPSDHHVTMDAVDLAAISAVQGDPADFIVSYDDDIEPTVAVIGHGESLERDCKLIGARYEGGNRMTLALVADDPRVYEADVGDPPPETYVPRLPPIPVGPAIDKIDVVVRGSRFAPELAVSIRPAAGAVTYIWELSYDHAAWRLLQDGGHTTWEGPVEATTVWVRVTAVGGVRGEPIEWFQNLTATVAAPAAISSVSTTALAEHAWVDFSLPAEDGIKGVIAKTSIEQGFDPETAGNVAYDGAPVGRVLIDFGGAREIYVRIAAYNVYGKTGLNWSSELKIVSRGISSGALSPELKAAFDNAAALPEGVVFRVDDDGDIAGLAIIRDGELQQVVAALLVDVLQVRTPAGAKPLLETTEDGVFIDTAFIRAITADEINARWGNFIDIRSGRWRGPPETGDNWDFNATARYISLKRPGP